MVYSNVLSTYTLAFRRWLQTIHWREHHRTRILMVFALFQGLLYISLVPPWQHYDEPTHFEYAWLIANQQSFPDATTVNPTLRREIAASMYAHSFYQKLQVEPPNFSLDPAPGLGYTQLNDPPLYYWLVSLPLQLVQHSDVTTQLYVARGVSLGLFMLTVWVAIRTMADLVAASNPLRWAVPLCLTLIPPFVDVMTAVNNDAGAVAIASIFLWGLVRGMRQGWTWQRGVWLVASAVIAFYTKNTATILVTVLPLLLLLLLWQWQGWRWHWLAGLFAILSFFAVSMLYFGSDSALWYRLGIAQPTPTRVNAPAGAASLYALRLPITANQSPILAQPFLRPVVQQLKGQRATLAGWFWADRTITIQGVSLAYNTSPTGPILSQFQPITLTTTPTFWAWTVDVPTTTFDLQYLISGRTFDPTAPEGNMFVHTPILVKGAFSTPPPVFAANDNQQALWNRQPVVNLVRNPTLERVWPNLKTSFDAQVAAYLTRSPVQSMLILLDTERSLPLLYAMVLKQMPQDFFSALGWGQLRILSGAWLWATQIIWLGALIGCGVWLFRTYRQRQPRWWLLPGILGTLIMLVWIGTAVRALPFLGTSTYTSIRYTYPAMISFCLVLAGGWANLFPHRYRTAGIISVCAVLALLNGVAVSTMMNYYSAF